MSAAPLSPQPALFELSKPPHRVGELFPAIWNALELLSSPQVDVRHQAMDQILGLDAHCLSPMVAYMVTTRIEDQDVGLRFRAVEAVGQVLRACNGNGGTPNDIRQAVVPYLSQMRRRKIYGLLQILESHPSAESDVAALLNACSFAGSTLALIFLDRKLSLEIRRQAIIFTGIVGFLDAIPALERLADRLESRMNGQRKMPFAPPSDKDEKSLLSAVQGALRMLKIP
jgi:hypothetical protein